MRRMRGRFTITQIKNTLGTSSVNCVATFSSRRRHISNHSIILYNSIFYYFVIFFHVNWGIFSRGK